MIASHNIPALHARKVSNSSLKDGILNLKYLHHTESKTATFSGNNYINYRILNPTMIRPLRQTNSPSIYRTAQNIISFSLATEEDFGTVLQLGDPVVSTEYALLEVGICY